MGISICPRNETSEHAMDLKVITKAQKVRLQKFKIKTMLVTFFDKHGPIHKEFVPDGQTFNSAFCVEVIGRLLKGISRVRPQFRAEGSWFLLHDNAPSHSALVAKTFLANHGVVEISHPPYSSDLAPEDLFFFPTVKTALKGKRFQDVEDIKKNVTAELNAVLLEAFVDCFK
jgi:histone-lysine N-methyltransferase SETMAR